MRNVTHSSFLYLLKMLTVYGIPNCDTVKKTLVWLKDNGIAYHFHDYKKEGISAEKLEEWLTQVPWEKLLNKASTTFKELSPEAKSAIVDKQSAMQLMLEKNSAIKRPVVEDGKVLAVGFKPDQYKDIFLLGA